MQRTTGPLAHPRIGREAANVAVKVSRRSELASFKIGYSFMEDKSLLLALPGYQSIEFI